MKKKIVVFSGAGLDAESGVATFRSNGGLWNNYNVDEVATPEGWSKDREKVLRFYNELRRSMPDVSPNGAHNALVMLEKDFDVTHVTQNVSDLLERAGASNIIHLHGELTKARGAMYNHKTSELDNIIDVGYNDINIGDKCSITGSQLRPHIVWFGEYPLRVMEAYKAVSEADILIIVGTSLQITYTLDLLNSVRRTENPCEVIYVDPTPTKYLDKDGLTIEYIEKNAVEGLGELVTKLLENNKN